MQTTASSFAYLSCANYCSLSYVQTEILLRDARTAPRAWMLRPVRRTIASVGAINNRKKIAWLLTNFSMALACACCKFSRVTHFLPEMATAGAGSCPDLHDSGYRRLPMHAPTPSFYPSFAPPESGDVDCSSRLTLPCRGNTRCNLGVK
jgi:hypothetical protein